MIPADIVVRWLCMQWFAVRRKHALLIVSDYLYYNKFKDYCKVHIRLTRCISLYLRSMKPLLPPEACANDCKDYLSF